MEKKICSKCNEEKSVTEFNKNKRIPGGFSSRCKQCRSVDRKESIGWSRDYKKDYHKKQMETNVLYRLKYSISPQLRKCMRKWISGGNGYTEKSRLREIMGCTFDEFMDHLKNQFEDWMVWGNYGLYNGDWSHGWDIDHIIPLSSAKTEEEYLKLWHYTNIRPLCSKQNRDVRINVI